jgi:hypothetical protein
MGSLEQLTLGEIQTKQPELSKINLILNTDNIIPVIKDFFSKFGKNIDTADEKELVKYFNSEITPAIIDFIMNDYSIDLGPINLTDGIIYKITNDKSVGGSMQTEGNMQIMY